MKNAINFLLVLPFVILTSSFKLISLHPTYNVSIEITNVRNKEGTIQLEVFRSQKEFEEEVAYKTYLISKKDISGNTLNCLIKDLEADTYGFALLDDENNNKKMDYGWGIPKEGFGLSDYYHSGWSKPVFKDFKFFLDADKSIRMKIRYM